MNKQTLNDVQRAVQWHSGHSCVCGDWKLSIASAWGRKVVVRGHSVWRDGREDEKAVMSFDVDDDDGDDDNSGDNGTEGAAAQHSGCVELRLTVGGWMVRGLLGWWRCRSVHLSCASS